MLTAFTFFEPEEQLRIQKEIKGSPLFEQELAISRKYTMEHINEKRILHFCPVCHHDEMTLFFEKWGIPYFRCSACYSIAAGVASKTAVEYEQLPELRSFYQSDEYQEQGREARDMRWDEILDWISFRSYRYLGINRELRVTDLGNRWKAFREKIQNSTLCGEYSSETTYDDGHQDQHRSDIVIAFDCIQRKTDPFPFLKQCYDLLDDCGLLFLGFKAGSGMDILILREKNRNVFPFEHLLMPSKEGIYKMLSLAGFDILEFITPGTFDVNYVKEHLEEIPKENHFIRYLLQTGNPVVDADLQRFIQKAGMSSYAQIVARKKK